MRVRATQTGYYGHKRRKAGEQFELTPMKNKDGTVTSIEQQFSSKWMEQVDASKSSKSGPKGKRAAAEEEAEAVDSHEVI